MQKSVILAAPLSKCLDIFVISYLKIYKAVVFAGIGFGMIYLPAVVCVGYYFETKRSLATGLAVCGSGFGTFVFAPLANTLLEQFGWKGANMILAGLILNCAVSSLSARAVACAVFCSVMLVCRGHKQTSPQHSNQSVLTRIAMYCWLKSKLLQ